MQRSPLFWGEPNQVWNGTKWDPAPVTYIHWCRVVILFDCFKINLYLFQHGTSQELINNSDFKPCCKICDSWLDYTCSQCLPVANSVACLRLLSLFVSETRGKRPNAVITTQTAGISLQEVKFNYRAVVLLRTLLRVTPKCLDFPPQKLSLNLA